MTLRLGLIRTS